MESGAMEDLLNDSFVVKVGLDPLTSAIGKANRNSATPVYSLQQASHFNPPSSHLTNICSIFVSGYSVSFRNTTGIPLFRSACQNS